VKHAGPDTLASLEDLLAQLRAVDGLVERRPGVFYRRSRAFLHFHEDPGGVFADVRLPAEVDFVRVRVSSPAERARLMREVRKATRTPARRQP